MLGAAGADKGAPRESRRSWTRPSWAASSTTYMQPGVTTSVELATVPLQGQSRNFLTGARMAGSRDIRQAPFQPTATHADPSPSRHCGPPFTSTSGSPVQPFTALTLGNSHDSQTKQTAGEGREPEDPGVPLCPLSARRSRKSKVNKREEAGVCGRSEKPQAGKVRTVGTSGCRGASLRSAVRSRVGCMTPGGTHRGLETSGRSQTWSHP